TGHVQFEKSLGATVPLGSLKVDQAKSIYLSNNFMTSGKDVVLNAPLHLRGDAKIDTTAGGLHVGGADILVLHGVVGNHRLYLDAGHKGTIRIEEGVGVGGAVLSAITMKGSSIHVKGDVKADGGTIIYNGPVYLSGDVTMIDTGPTGIIFLDILNSSGPSSSLTLSAPIGKVLFLGEVGGVTPLQDVTISSNKIEIQSNMTLAGNLLLQGPVYLLDDVFLIAANITATKTIDGPHDFTLDVGSSGTISLQNNVGQKVRIGDFDIVNAATVNTQAIYASTIVQEAGTGTTVFNGILDTVYKGGIELNGVNFTLTAGATTTNGGHFLVNQSGNLIILQAMDISGAFSQASIGNVRLSGNITTNQQNIAFTGHVLLQGPVSLSTGDEGPGGIRFLDEIDSTFGSDYSLDLTLGGGDLLFADTVGAFGSLGDILVHNARNVTASDFIRSLSYTQLQGLGTGSYAGNITATGDLGIYIFSNYLNFAGQASGKVLTTIGNGNIMLNAIYGELGSASNPIKMSIRGGLGTFYEGDFGTVYFSSDAGQVASVCQVRSNPGCTVLYSMAGGAYQDVTPDTCCTQIPIPPPPPPHKHHNHKEHLPPKGEMLYYIPGIYTNYWFFKDTLGAAWYFTSDFTSRWWDETTYLCKPSLEGMPILNPYCYSDLPAIKISIENQSVVTQDILAKALQTEPTSTSAVSKIQDIQQVEGPSYFWNKFFLVIGLLSIGGTVISSGMGQYRWLFGIKKPKKTIYKTTTVVLSMYLEKVHAFWMVVQSKRSATYIDCAEFLLNQLEKLSRHPLAIKTKNHPIYQKTVFVLNSSYKRISSFGLSLKDKLKALYSLSLQRSLSCLRDLKERQQEIYHVVVESLQNSLKQVASSGVVIKEKVCEAYLECARSLQDHPRITQAQAVFKKVELILSNSLKKTFAVSVFIKDEISQGVLGCAKSLMTFWDSLEKSRAIRKINSANFIIKTRLMEIITECAKSLSMHIHALTKTSKSDEALKEELTEILSVFQTKLSSVYKVVKKSVNQVISLSVNSLSMHLRALTRKSRSSNTFKREISRVLSIFQRQLTSINSYVKGNITAIISSYKKSLSMHLGALTSKSRSSNTFKHEILRVLSIFQRQLTSINSYVKEKIIPIISPYKKSLSMHLGALTRKSRSSNTFKHEILRVLSIFQRQLTSTSGHVKRKVVQVVSSCKKSLSMHLGALTRKPRSSKTFKHEILLVLSIFERQLNSISRHVKGKIIQVVSSYKKSLSVHLRTLKRPTAIRRYLLLSLKKAYLTTARISRYIKSLRRKFKKFIRKYKGR
ncbi:MAG: calcium-binding protein, partial [Verrucomicrobia bacterium]|nr:calcium-binding protein [Verrucomicrobiota bacterium]